MLFVAFVESDAEKLGELAEIARKRGSVEGMKTIAQYGTPVGKGVHIFEAETVEVSCDRRHPVIADGEHVGWLPAICSIEPAALTVLGSLKSPVTGRTSPPAPRGSVRNPGG